jgi:hypothetical protein
MVDHIQFFDPEASTDVPPGRATQGRFVERFDRLTCDDQRFSGTPAYCLATLDLQQPPDQNEESHLSVIIPSEQGSAEAGVCQSI